MSDPEIERLLSEVRGAGGAPQGGAPPPAQETPADALLKKMTALEAQVGAAAGASAQAPATEGGAPAAAPAEGLLSRALGLRQASILSARYVDLKLGDLGGTLILIAQAPLIGFLVGLGFDGEAESLRLQFVLAMVAVWFGTFNACREVVKERLIFLRERRTGVSVRAYLVSKLGVLAFLAGLQCLLLVALVARTVRFDASPPAVFLALFLTALTSTALGLFLSSVVKSQNSLIALVPIALIPQLIFSEAILNNPPLVVERIELAMIAEWGLDLLRELKKSDPSWLTVGQDAGVLALMGLGLLLAAGVALRSQEE